MTERVSALVLEDETIVAFALEDMLLDLGFEEVRLSTTVAAALDQLETGAPDFAVLDVNVRGERSYGVAYKLSRLGVPFIFATGYGDAEHPEALRAIPTLTKPYNVDELKGALAAAANCGEG